MKTDNVHISLEEAEELKNHSSFRVAIICRSDLAPSSFEVHILGNARNFSGLRRRTKDSLSKLESNFEEVRFIIEKQRRGTKKYRSVNAAMNDLVRIGFGVMEIDYYTYLGSLVERQLTNHLEKQGKQIISGHHNLDGALSLKRIDDHKRGIRSVACKSNDTSINQELFRFDLGNPDSVNSSRIKILRFTTESNEESCFWWDF